MVHHRSKFGCLTRIAADRAATWVAVTAIMVTIAGCQASPDESQKAISVSTIALAEDPRLVDLAELAIAEGRYRDAEDLVNRALLAGTNNRAKLLKAEIYLANGAANKAAQQFGELVDDPDVSAQALQGKGIALLHGGVTEEAYQSLRRAVGIDATLWRAWNALGYYHDSNRDWHDAAKSYENAMSASPNSALIFNNRGYSNLVQRKFDDAIADFAKAIELGPGIETARLNLRLALAWKGRYARAMLGVSNRNIGKALNNVGFVALLRGDYLAAESHFLRALESDASFNKSAWRNLEYLNDLKKIEANELSK